MSATDAEKQAIMAGAYWPLALGLIGSSVTPTYAAPGDVALNVDRGDGTLGTRTDCPANKAVLGTLYGDPASQIEGEYAPATPTIPSVSVVNDLTGTSVTVTVDGDAGVTNYIIRKTPSATGWTAAGSRSGDGTVSVTGLTENQSYIISAYSTKDAVNSQPAPAVFITPTANATIIGAFRLERGIYYTLANTAAIAAVVSTRIYPAGSVPQNAALPYIIFQRMDNAHIRHMTGGAGIAKATYKFAAWAAEQDTAQDLCDRIRHVFDNKRSATWGDPAAYVNLLGSFLDADLRDFEEPVDGSEQGPCVAGLTVLFWHAESVTSA